MYCYTLQYRSSQIKKRRGGVSKYIMLRPKWIWMPASSVSCIYLFIYVFTHPPTRSLIYLFIYYLFIYIFVYLFIYLFIYLCIYLFIYSFTYSNRGVGCLPPPPSHTRYKEEGALTLWSTPWNASSYTAANGRLGFSVFTWHFLRIPDPFSFSFERKPSSLPPPPPRPPRRF